MVLKFIKRSILVILVLFLLIFIAGSIFVLTQEDKIKSLLIQEINDELTTSVQVEDVQLKFIQNFPNISAQFSGVFIASTPKFRPSSISGMNPDTLLFAKSLNFSLNSFALLRRKLEFSRLTIRDGIVNMGTDQNKNKNYEIFAKKKSSDSLGLILNVQQLQLKNIRFRLTSIPSRLVIDLHAKDMKFSYRQLQAVLNSKGKIFIYEIKNARTSWVQDQETQVDGKLQFSSQGLYLDNINLILGDVPLKVDGDILTSTPVKLDLRTNIKNQSITKLVPLIPVRIQDQLSRFQIDGSVSVEGHISGIAEKKSGPDLQFDYEINGGSLGDPSLGVFLNNVELGGSFSGTQKTTNIPGQISVSKFKALLKNEEINGSFNLKDLNNPFLELSVSGNLDLSDLQTFLQIESIESLGGLAHTNISLSGKLNQLKTAKLKDLELFEPVGHIELYDVFIKTKQSPILYSSISGSVMLGKHFWLDGISLNINDNPVSLTGEVRNILPFLNKQKEPLLLRAALSSPRFDLGLLVANNEDPGMQKETRSIVRFPKMIITNIDVSVREFIFGRFEANDFRGQLLYEPGMLFLDSLSFLSMQGRVSGNVVALKQNEDLFEMQVYANLNGIDIKEMFYSFKDFGQSFISQENLGGQLYGEVYYYSNWSSGLKVQKESIITDADFRIENGQLVQFEPIQSLSRYIAVSELENIQFSTLENEIYIKDNVITIPQMDIKSSAFNITASGTHHFNNQFNYKIKVLLSEILASKVKKAKKENTEFGIIEDDGLGRTSLYFKIDGVPGNIDVSYDKKEMVQTMKLNLKKEGQNFSKIIKDEFGTSRQDSSSTQTGKEKKKFLIKWDEADSVKIDTNTMDHQRFNLIWDEELQPPDTSSFVIKNKILH